MSRPFRTSCVGLLLLAQSAGDARALGKPSFAAPASPSAVAPKPSSPIPGASLGAAVPPSPSDRLSYDLRAELLPQQRAVKGSGRVRFTNTGPQPLRELWFHLYLNAFKNNRTLFSRSPFTAGRSGDKPRVWGHIDVHALRDTRSGGDLWPQRDRHSPGDPEDETDIRVPLTQPLGAGETVELELEWTSQLPEIVERTGFSRDYYFVAQWFPKLAKYEPASGTFRHFAFHPHAEFYADYAAYSVKLSVPKEYQVGATGACTPNAAMDSSERKSLDCRATQVHDFAFTAWPGFLVHEETLGAKQIRVLYPPGHALNLERTLFSVRQGFRHFEQLYGPYPYPMLTVVHPPDHARSSGGMEYPTLITTGGAWYTPLYSRGTELMTLHELAHQWFYGLVGSDEARWPFLDEGFTSYAEGKLARELFGASSAASVFGFTLSLDGTRHAAAAEHGLDQAIASSASEFRSFGHLGALAYARTAALLDTLELIHGHAFTEVMRAYTARFRYAHPTPEDFLQVVREKLGDHVAEQARRALFERGWVDFTVHSVESARAAKPAGVFGEGPTRRTEASDPSVSRDGSYVGRALVVRRGDLVFPVQVQLKNAAGEVTVHTWDGQAPSTFIEYRGEHPLVSAEVDPYFQIRLDQNRLNNSGLAEAAPSGHGLRTQERLTFWAQLLLQLLGP